MSPDGKYTHQGSAIDSYAPKLINKTTGVVINMPMSKHLIKHFDHYSSQS